MTREQQLEAALWRIRDMTPSEEGLLDLIRNLAREAIATPPDPNTREWQPIETAPRDGTEILTMRSNGYIRNARWYNNPFGRKDTVIDNADGSWWSVTSWMPLPPIRAIIEGKDQ